MDGYIPWHQAKNSTYYHSFEYHPANHLKVLRLKSKEESFYNSGEFSQVFQIDSRFIFSTRTGRRKKSRPALAINKMKKLFRHEHWNINNTPVIQIYRVSQKTCVSLWQLISPLLIGLLPYLRTVLNSHWSLLLNGHQDIEDWPKNAGARARNVKAGLRNYLKNQEKWGKTLLAFFSVIISSIFASKTIIGKLFQRPLQNSPW